MERLDKHPVALFAVIVLALFSSDSLWMLPGLWSLLFSLGVFASSTWSTWAKASFLNSFASRRAHSRRGFARRKMPP